MWRFSTVSALTCIASLGITTVVRAQTVPASPPSPVQADRKVEDTPTSTSGDHNGEAAAASGGAAASADTESAESSGGHKRGRRAKAKTDPKPTESKGEGGGVEFETDAGTFRLKGRVVARADLQRHWKNVARLDASGSAVYDADANPVYDRPSVDSLDLSVADARLDLRYTSPVRWLSAEIEADLSASPVLKDAYAEAKGTNLMARAGQFKMPVSSIEMESPWALPVIDRGLISEILLDRLDIAGRRPGVMVSARSHGPLRPKLTLGAFQASMLTEVTPKRKTSTLEAQQLASQNFVGRVGIGIGDVEIGAYYEHRINSLEPYKTAYYWTAGLDIAADWVFSYGGLRVWIDGVSGASGIKHPSKPNQAKDATFVTARALLGFRFGGVVDNEFYVEPFVLAGVIDPDLDVVSDYAWDASAGINVGLWRRARLSIQGEMEKDSRNFPDGYFYGAPVDRYRLLLQAGVAF